jgi:hypothetical protein
MPSAPRFIPIHHRVSADFSVSYSDKGWSVVFKSARARVAATEQGVVNSSDVLRGIPTLQMVRSLLADLATIDPTLDTVLRNGWESEDGVCQFEPCYDQPGWWAFFSEKHPLCTISEVRDVCFKVSTRKEGLRRLNAALINRG